MAEEFIIDWRLPEGEVIVKIDEYIDWCCSNDYTLALPYPPDRDIVEYTLSQIDCAGCDMRCCNTVQSDLCNGEIALTIRDWDTIKANYPHKIWSKLLPKLIQQPYGVSYLPPCPFIVGNRCQVYEYRPLVCRVYPIDYATMAEGNDKVTCLGLSSSCPQAVKHARAILQNVKKLMDFKEANK